MTRVARAATVLLLLILPAVGGCRTTPKPPKPRLDPPPDYATLVGAYNARATQLTQIWARSVVRVWYPDEQGEEQSDQVEGHLMFEPPDRLYLTFNKLGETYAVLGANAEQYWWIELRGERRAWTGRHDRATLERAEEVGLPVQPLDLVELLGVLPLPESPVEAPRVTWSEDGRRVEVTLRVDRRSVEGAVGGGRPVRLALDERSLLPARIELLDERGEPLMRADLEGYEPVRVRSANGAPIATRFIATLEGGRKRFKLWLYDPERRGAPVGRKVFDWPWLKKTYRVEDERSLDDPG